MSYPGYPGYPQASGQQPNQPPGPPMYQTTPLSYPEYPGSAVSQPSYPPYGISQPPYPQSSSPYPQQSSPYPSGNPSPYPSAAPQSYPGTTSFPSQPSYPPVGTTYPGSQSSPYPSGNPSPYPQTSSGVYPPNPSYPSQPSFPSASAYPGPQAQPSHPGAGYPKGAVYTNPAHNPSSSIKTSTPTVRPANPFNPREDAEILRKAMKGFGTDEKALISVITKRTNSQRLQIVTEFKTLYGKDLISDIKGETSGYFEDVLVSLLMPTPEFLAKEINHAISGIGTVEETLVEILCTASNYDIKCITMAYNKLYGRSLEQELASDTSGSFKRLLVSLCQANRSEIYQIDQGAAVQDAQALLRAGELRLGTDESTFNAILCSRSYPQLAQIFIEYQRLTGNDFEQAIRSEFSGDIELGLIAVVKSVRNKPDFFAEALYRSMAGAGTKDRALIRIICSRCEIDLGDIKVAYQRMFGKSLEEAVASETSGDYKKALLSLLN